MEGKKEEAIKAKLIAKKKQLEKDYAEAKKFILQAKNMFLTLKDMNHLTVIIDIHMNPAV